MRQTEEEYFHYQTVVGKSHEEDSPQWSEGQIRFIDYINHFLHPQSVVLDCACGDGIGLEELERLGHIAYGMDISEQKLSRARKRKQKAFFGDMHVIGNFPNVVFDAILSSHTLEHAHDPEIAVKNFYNKLCDEGMLFVVLPFPDPGEWNKDIHVGKWDLKTDGEDPDKVISFFINLGFTVVDTKTDDYREPELWIALKK